MVPVAPVQWFPILSRSGGGRPGALEMAEPGWRIQSEAEPGWADTI